MHGSKENIRRYLCWSSPAGSPNTRPAWDKEAWSHRKAADFCPSLKNCGKRRQKRQSGNKKNPAHAN